MRYDLLVEIYTTDAFDRWLSKLKDHRGRARITLALRRWELEGRLVGDMKTVGDQVSEVRFHFGPGYRVYFTRNGDAVVLLLVGGDKSTQSRDIVQARALAAQIREEQQWL